MFRGVSAMAEPEERRVRCGKIEEMVTIRAALAEDRDAVWSILDPILRAGDVYALPSDLSREEALAYWFSAGHEVFVAESHGVVAGTYYLRANQRGGGSHVANCGYATAESSRGRGVAAAMCAHSLERARDRGFRAMQFNFVVSSNEGAVRLWQRHGFQIVGTLPKAFLHPALGYTDAFVMYREL
jgi:ribosomal protein S18 acetylase RimI-like enzyme